MMRSFMNESFLSISSSEDELSDSDDTASSTTAHSLSPTKKESLMDIRAARRQNVVLKLFNREVKRLNFFSKFKSL